MEPVIVKIGTYLKAKKIHKVIHKVLSNKDKYCIQKLLIKV